MLWWYVLWGLSEDCVCCGDGHRAMCVVVTVRGLCAVVTVRGLSVLW